MDYNKAHPDYIQAMAESLKKASVGRDRPPTVEFDVGWLDVRTMDSGPQWEPVITFKVFAEIDVSGSSGGSR